MYYLVLEIVRGKVPRDGLHAACFLCTGAFICLSLSPDFILPIRAQEACLLLHIAHAADEENPFLPSRQRRKLCRISAYNRQPLMKLPSSVGADEDVSFVSRC